MTERLRAVGRTTCEHRGYEVMAPDRPWLPTYLAEPTDDTSPFVSRATHAQVAIEPLDDDEVTPTTLLSRLRNNSGHDRFSLFVVASESAARIAHEILYDPPLVASEDAHGGRVFYNGPDRIPLAEGGYAAVRTDSAAEDLVWRESGEADDRDLLLVDDGDVLDDGNVLAVLDGVDDLACPAAETFPYSYRRDTDDKRFRVRTGDGRTVGVYDGVAAMRSNAYRPVPMPLVPEHVFRGVSSVRDEWALLVVDTDSETNDIGSDPADVGSKTTGGDAATRLVTAGTY